MSSKEEIYFRRSQYQKEYAKTPRRRFSSGRLRVTKKGIQFVLSFEEYALIIEKPCYYCNRKMTDECGLGLDRVDNSIGYVINNVVSCCSICNGMKSNYPFDWFLSHIQMVYKNLFDK